MKALLIVLLVGLLLGCASTPASGPGYGPDAWDTARQYCEQRSADDVQRCAQQYLIAKNQGHHVGAKPKTALEKWREKHGASAARSAVGLGLLWWILRETR